MTTLNKQTFPECLCAENWASYCGYKTNKDIVSAFEKLGQMSKLINEQCFKYVDEDSSNEHTRMFVLSDYHPRLHIIITH